LLGLDGRRVAMLLRGLPTDRGHQPV